MNTSFEELHSQLISHGMSGWQPLIPQSNNMSSISVSWQGREHVIALAQEDTLRDVGIKIAEATGTSLETLKLLLGGRVVVPARAPDEPAVDAGTPLLRLQHATACHAWHCQLSLHCETHVQLFCMQHLRAVAIRHRSTA